MDYVMYICCACLHLVLLVGCKLTPCCVDRSFLVQLPHAPVNILHTPNAYTLQLHKHAKGILLVKPQL